MSGPAPEAARLALAALAPGVTVEALAPLGSGHIHETFLASCRSADGAPRFVLQRINTHVFPDPDALAANFARVSETVKRAVIARGAEPDRRCLRAVVAPDGDSLHRDDDGSCWRAFPFIENSRACDTIDSPVRAEAAAHAFGGFIADLADLAPDSLRATIPGFHDLPARIRALESAIATDPIGRLATARDEVDAAQRHAERILAGRDPEALPQRVVHNDCKINNLLFDADTDEPLCVVDLDTVMAGSALYDFGELVRTGASTASEDERDLPRVRFDLALFRPLVAGFVAGGRGAFTAEEIDAFAEAGPRMALENAVRFLADHLEGDRYFRVHREGHNLDRARVQLRLLESMRDAETDVRAILAGLSGAAS